MSKPAQPKTVDLKTVLVRRGRNVQSHIDYVLETGEYRTLATLLLALESNGAYSLCDEVKTLAKEAVRSKQQRLLELKTAPVREPVEEESVQAEKQDEPNKKPAQKRRSSNSSEPLLVEPTLAVEDEK